MVNGEEFRRDVATSLATLVTLQKETNKKLDKLCGCVAKEKSLDDIKLEQRDQRKLLYKIAGGLSIVLSILTGVVVVL